jgi:hypothetical protein
LSGGDSLSVPQHDGGDGVVLARDGKASCRHRLSEPGQHQDPSHFSSQMRRHGS